MRKLVIIPRLDEAGVSLVRLWNSWNVLHWKAGVRIKVDVRKSDSSLQV
jgi:hypothetical protein